MILNISKTKEFKVNVSCMTFNHAGFIRDAMDGFCMQQTDFPFVCTIVDDASTDGEQEVISAYLNEHFDLGDINTVQREETNDYTSVFARHKTNPNCYFAVYYLKENHYSKKRSKRPYLQPWRESAEYIALCEGDDYWTDPLKLQKQVDFLDSHPDYSIVFHNAEIQNLAEIPFNKIELEEREYTTDEVFEKWIVPTASVVIRKDAVVQNNDKRLLNGDLWINLCGLHHGRGYAFKKEMSVYRRHEEGITLKRFREEKLNHIKKYIDHHNYLKETFPKISKKVFNRKQGKIYYELVFKLDEKRKKRIMYLWKSFFLYPRYCMYNIGHLILYKIKMSSSKVEPFK